MGTDLFPIKWKPMNSRYSMRQRKRLTYWMSGISWMRMLPHPLISFYQSHPSIPIIMMSQKKIRNNIKRYTFNKCDRGSGVKWWGKGWVRSGVDRGNRL